jgi:hypothetical protein
MTDVTAATTAGLVADGRPVARLPNRELIRISLYWLGLSSIFAGLSYITASRLEFTGLVDKADAGRALFLVSISGAIIAIIVQPTIGSISDYTISRWGRRKPYIFIGSLLDLVFLVGIAYSNTLVAMAAFIALLQFSSNFAQGPFQGYVPDLVPAPQVGTASALVGLMQVLGVVSGYAIGALAAAYQSHSASSRSRRWCRSSSGSGKGRRPSRARVARGAPSRPRLGAPTSSRSTASSGWSPRACRS